MGYAIMKTIEVPQQVITDLMSEASNLKTVVKEQKETIAEFELKITRLALQVKALSDRNLAISIFNSMQAQALNEELPF